MKNHRKLIRASKRSWTHMVPANTVRFLHVPVRRTVWELEIGTMKLRMEHQARPVTPDAFKDDRPRQHEAYENLLEAIDSKHPWRNYGS